jgi:hypothetical protein
MASIEDLPADQRAVLQMVLQRGRSYDEIAGLLSIDRSAVRQRALDAFDALTPEGIERGPEQGLLTDYLLSQLPQQVAEQVYIYLQGAEDDREWAAALTGPLSQFAASPLPELPVVAPVRRDEPAAAERWQPPYSSDDASAPDAGPIDFAATTAGNQTPAPRTAVQARGKRARSRTAEPRRHDRVMLAFLAAAALITVAVVVAVLVLVGGSGSGSGGPLSASKPRRVYTYTPHGKTVTQTTASTTTNAEPQILAALNLTSPVGAARTLGVAQVVKDNGVVGVVIDAQGVPRNSAHNAYGLWLYNSASSDRFVGFDPNLVGKNGKLAIEGALPTGASHYRRLLITLETQQHPKTPGEVVLSGPFREK